MANTATIGTQGYYGTVTDRIVAIATQGYFDALAAFNKLSVSVEQIQVLASIEQLIVSVTEN